MTIKDISVGIYILGTIIAYVFSVYHYSKIKSEVKNMSKDDIILLYIAAIILWPFSLIYIPIKYFHYSLVNYFGKVHNIHSLNKTLQQENEDLKKEIKTLKGIYR